MDTDDKWAAFWACWVATFAVGEAIALRSKSPEAPLSHSMRRVLGVRRHPIHNRLGQAAFAAGVIWLTRHIWFEVAQELEDLANG